VRAVDSRERKETKKIFWNLILEGKPAKGEPLGESVAGPLSEIVMIFIEDICWRRGEPSH
jgi:hypothetical protein